MNSEIKQYDYMMTLLLPVYGIPERILREGLDCLLSQTFLDVNFLVVNDCSPDDYTINVLNEYAAKDKRFTIVTNEQNLGITDVRQMALELSVNSKYFIMFDPDDLIPENYLQVLFDNAEYYNADMVTVKLTEFNDGEEIDITNNIKSSDFYKLKLPLKRRRIYRQTFICRLFKRETIGDLRFEKKLMRGSDLLFINQYLIRCERCVDLNFPAYFYRHGRVFSGNEVAVPARPKNQYANLKFMEMDMIIFDGFCRSLLECKAKDEVKFIKYMLIRRYMRSVFGTRHSKSAIEEKYQVYHDYYEKTIAAVAEDYPIFNKLLKSILHPSTICKHFYGKLNFLRLYFEIMHLWYHIRKSCHKLKVLIYKVA